MQYLLLVYTDEALLGELPAPEFDAEMRECIARTDSLQAQGTLLAARQLEPSATARSVRQRGGRTTVLDGPFAETKEVVAGFILIEADSMDAAVEQAQQFPWVRYGCVEVRPVCDGADVRARAGAASA
jgi:hypothetical protein